MNGGNIGGGTVSGTLYVSFLAKSNRLSRDWLGQIVTGTYTAPAPSGQVIAESFLGFQLYRSTTEVLGIGESFAGSNYGVFSTGATATPVDFAPATRVNNATRLFVAKITFKSGATDDIKVWLDPNSALSEAAQTGASITQLNWNDLSFNRIAFRSGSSNNDGSVDFDEVRMGTTWDSVLPQTPNPATAGVVVNEFAASNTGTIRDEDGDASDWIELYNGSASPVTLDGLYLSDSAALATKWQFPDTTPDRVLGPGQYLIVWASNKDAAKRPAYTSTSQLHTNFQLSTNTGPSPDVLNLTASDGTTLISGFGAPYPVQSSVATYGRDGAAVGYMLATPATANGDVFSSPPPILTIAPGSGVRTGPTVITITGQQPGQTVRYTLDGSLPSVANGFTYNAPFTVSSTAQVRARVAQPGVNGPATSAVQLFVQSSAQPDAVSAYHLPILVIDTHGRVIAKDGSDQSNEYPSECSYVLYDAPLTGVDLRATVPQFLSRGRISARGKSTSTEAKRPFNVEFWRDDRDEDTSRGVLGMASDSDWVLNNIYNFDRGGLRNKSMFDLSNQIGQWAPDSRYVEVWLNEDGGDLQASDYYGMFVLIEKPNRGGNRVDVEALEADDNTAPNVTGGYILQLNKSYNAPASDFHIGIGFGVGVSSAAAGSFNFNITGTATGNNTSDFFLEYPEEDKVTTPQASYMSAYLNNFEDCLSPTVANFTNPTTSLRYNQYIDVASWVDHNLLNAFPNNVDGLRLSFRLFKPRNDLLYAGPVWDFDRSMNSVDGRDDNPLQWHATAGGYGTQFFILSWWQRLFAEPDFMQAWVDRWTNLRRPGQPMSNANLQAIVNANAAIVSPPALPTANAALRNQTRWNAVPYTAGSLNAERDLIKNWMVARTGFIDGQILQTPAFNIGGGAITTATALTVSSADFTGVAKMYYTTDGSDPRLAGGAVNPAATEFTGAFTLPAGHRLVRTRLLKTDAPAFNSTLNTTKMSTWSGVTEAYFFTDAVPAAMGNLVVSELMYHPADPTAAEITAGFTDSDQFEYIELLNVGASPIDLFESAFSSGIDYRFRNGGITQLAPGERLLIVKNLAAFTQRYGAPATARVAGVFAGNDNLDNAGETLTIVDRLGAVILSFTYDDIAPWPTFADGLGWSLVLRNPNPASNMASPASWRISAVKGGEPAGIDSRIFTGLATADADGDGIAALLEHAAGTSDTDATSGAMPAASIVTDGGIPYLALTYTVDLHADDVTAIAERTTSLLTTWLSGPAETVVFSSTTNDATGIVTIQARSTQPFTGLTIEFLRLSVSVP